MRCAMCSRRWLRIRTAFTLFTIVHFRLYAADSMTYLILQSPCLNSERIENIAAIARAGGVQVLGNTAARLIDVDVDESEEVARQCEAMSLDYAFLDEIRRFNECRILAMDMDSTLINIECIDEIADEVGRKAQVAAITEAAMRGEIKDFAESLRRRVALLEGVPIQALERVYTERLQLNAGAERLIAAAKRVRVRVMVVSGGFTFFTEKLKLRLGLDEAHANTLEVVDGVLTGRVLGDIVDGQRKADCLRALAHKLGAKRDQIIALGDGANDLKMLALAGYSVAYRAKPIVQEQAGFALNVSGLDGVLNWFRA